MFLWNPVRTIFCMIASDLSACIADVNIGYICYTYALIVCPVSCSIVSLSSVTYSVKLTKHSGAIHSVHTCRIGKQ